MVQILQLFDCYDNFRHNFDYFDSYFALLKSYSLHLRHCDFSYIDF